MVFKWHLKWYLKLIPKNNSILASKNGILDVLGDLLGGPGALKSKFRRVLFERPIWLPVQTPLFHPNLPRKCPQRGASWRLLELLCVQKLVKKCAQGTLCRAKMGFNCFVAICRRGRLDLHCECAWCPLSASRSVCDKHCKFKKKMKTSEIPI